MQATTPAVQRYLLQLHGFVQLVRPTNSCAAAALVVVGATLTHVHPLPAQVWTATAAMWCVTAAGYVANDLADIAEDRINKPARPLPSGRLSSYQAQRLRSGLIVVALLLAAWTSIVALVSATCVLILLHLYDQRLKATPGLGNALVALLAGCALLTGAVAALGLSHNRLLDLLPAAATLGCFVAAREVLKTVQDVAGDSRHGKQTLAVRFGLDATIKVYAVLAWTTIGMSLIPAYLYNYGPTYLLVMIAGVHLPLLLPLLARRTAITQSMVRRWLRHLKVSYLLGIIALLLA